MKKLNIKKIFETEINNNISNMEFFLKNNFEDFVKFLDFIIKTAIDWELKLQNE